MTPYRPSNSVEGEEFAAEFCDRCRSTENCDIKTRAWWLATNHANYPVELQYIDSKPVCTAFVERA
jgi:hypothetical protein